MTASGLHRVEGRGPAQLESIVELAARALTTRSRWHPGELVSFWFLDAESWERVATWSDDGRCLAWARVGRSGRMDLQVDPARPAVLTHVLEWFDRSPAADRVLTCSDAEECLLDDLRRRGWRRRDVGPVYDHLWCDLDQLPPAPRLPAGASIATAVSRTAPAERSTLHRAAFGTGRAWPSQDAFAAMSTHPLYSGALDVATVLAGGTLGGACHAWLDGVSGVVALEPVATDTRHRRLGHARAAIHAALSAARDAGATRARVCARVDDDLSAAALYAGVGFRPRARTVHLVR